MRPRFGLLGLALLAVQGLASLYAHSLLGAETPGGGEPTRGEVAIIVLSTSPAGILFGAALALRWPGVDRLGGVAGGMLVLAGGASWAASVVTIGLGFMTPAEAAVLVQFPGLLLVGAGITALMAPCARQTLE